MEPSANQELKKAYLIVDGSSVYELNPNSVVNIGRLETNNVPVDDYRVSREHAILKYLGDDFVLVDLASTHGTFVNGERIDRCVLKVGESFHVVNHEFLLRAERPAELKGVEVITPGLARHLDRRLKFFGGLNEFALITLVQFLYQEKQSGLLLLELGLNPGPRIYFQNGEIIHVVEAENLGELLTRSNHDQSLFFYFHHETDFPERTITTSTPNYLMEMCHYQDVQKGTKTTPPLKAVVPGVPATRTTAKPTSRLD